MTDCGPSYKILKTINGLATRIELTASKCAEKFENPFSHLLIFGNIFAHCHGFDTMTVTISKYFVTLQLDREKLK